MKVTIEGSSSLQKYLKDIKELEIQGDIITVEGILKQCAIPVDEIGIIIINNTKSDFDSIVSDGDGLKLYPPIIAG